MIKDKIKTRKELSKICDAVRRSGKTIGFTSGGFDLLHAGHIDYLEKAKCLCDILIVGVNSDESVQKYKGPNRPIIIEEKRLKVVAALESVDYVFLFDERRNQKNIEILKPDFYIKAGDYQPEELTSKEVVEAYGGEVKIIPIKENISTTEIIEKAGQLSRTSDERFIEKEGAVHIQRKLLKSSPAIFLDRDGTINEEILYLHDPKKFKLLPNTVAGLKKMADMGYRLVIVSNQPGIGMGYYPEEDFYKVNREMMKHFSKANILIDKIYFCPHSKSEKCSCRKPEQTLIGMAQKELNIDLRASFFIGDKTSDMETGKRADMKTILVKTGFRGKDGEYGGEPDYWADDLLDAADTILRLERT
jgi:rfaE bifunctional protein nucleotidyltransferase chain/domain